MTGTTVGEVKSVCRSGEISETVVTTVAEATGLDPLEMEPLFSVIDPDALNKLFSPSRASPPTEMQLEFTMEGCQVVVRGDGEVAVTPPEKTAERPAAIASSED